jgi:protein SCO1/2
MIALVSLLALAQAPTPSAAVHQRIGGVVAKDLVFTDETGSSVALGAYFEHKPVVVALVYYECPMLCSLVLNGMLRALRPVTLDAGKDFEVVVVSIDPRETPELAAKKKATYLASYRRPGTEKGWHFLVGKPAEIEKLADAVGFEYAFDEKSGQYAHPAGLTILTKGGRVSRYLDGIEYSAKDLRLALVEASEDKLGTIVDRMLLLCFHYDPSQGKYTLVAMNVLRIAGGLTVLLVGGFVFLMLRRDRRAKTALQGAS